MQSSASSRNLKITSVAASVLFGAFTAVYIIPRFFPWSEWNCEHQEMDINTGRLKFSKHLFYLKISERTEDSNLSKVLPKERIDRSTPDWRRVNTFSPGVRHSPHYAFHSAFFQVRLLSNWWEAEAVPQSVQRKTATHLIALWKYADSDSLGRNYLASLPSAGEAALWQKVARIESIHMPLMEMNGAKLTMSVFYADGTRLARSEGYFDTTGRFVQQGISEQWYPDAKIQLYDHYKAGVIHGRRFEWSGDGMLSSIAAFRSGELVEYESDNLDRHPDYTVAQHISAANGSR